jgi:hypothetical protein
MFNQGRHTFFLKAALPAVLPTLALAAALTLCATNAVAAPVYRETFQFCPRVSNDRLQASQLVGWTSMRKGRAPGDMGALKSSRPGNEVVPNTPLRAQPVGALTGNVLWTKQTTGLTIFTQEFSFDIGSVSSVKYDQRLDGFSSALARRDGTRLALLIDGVWYISDTTYRVAKRSVWETVSVDLKGTTFGTVPGNAQVGPGTPANAGNTLPANGTVTAFGVYVPRVSNRVRIDNFIISDSTAGADPAPDTVDLLPCSDSVSVIATPTPTAAPGSTATVPAGSTPTAPPGSTATPAATSTTGPGVVIPTVGATATNTPVATVVAPSGVQTPTSRALFCSDTQLKALGNLRVPRKFNRLVVTTLPGRSLKGLRDRFLMAIILEKNPRLDLLVNTIVDDYDVQNGILNLPATARADGDFTVSTNSIGLKLGRFTQSQGAKYLKRYLRDGNRKKYLFPRVNRGTEKLIDTALCSPQLRRLVRLRAERAGFRIRFNG